MGVRLQKFADAVHEPPKRGGYSMAEKRKLVSRIRKALHPPVSSMSREHIVQYMYGLALEQNVNWEPYFEAASERKRVPKGCYRMTGPGTAEYEPPAPRAKRAPSAYNRFVREQMLYSMRRTGRGHQKTRANCACIFVCKTIFKKRVPMWPFPMWPFPMWPLPMRPFPMWPFPIWPSLCGGI